MFFVKIFEPFLMNMANGSIRIFPKLKRDTVENGIQILGTQTGENERQKKTK